MEWVTRYWGTDLLGILFSFLMLYSLGNHKRYGFLLGATANVWWMVFGFIVGTVPLILANFVFCCLNLRGYWRWPVARPVLPGSEEAMMQNSDLKSKA